MKTGRNDPCPCGSGKKYKRCCLIKRKRKSLVFAAAGLAVILGGMAAILKEFSQADPSSALPGRVWSEEHGHWHTVSPAGPGSVTRPLLPPGPAPPGKVWSAAHGHWHKAPSDVAPAPREGSATTPR